MLSRTSLALAAVVVPVLMLSACDGSDTASDNAGSSSAKASATTTSGAQGAADTCKYPSDGAGSAGKKVTAPPAKPTVSGTVPVRIKTSVGPIGLRLDATEAPCTVNSFVSLAKQGYFDNTTCHRLTTQGIYVLQCGDPSGTGSGGPGYSFADELDGAKALKTDQEASSQTGQDYKTYPAGTIAMANAGPDTNGSQFFLVYADSPLPPAYSVFGRIDTNGTRLISMIAADGTDNGTADGHPKKNVTFASVTVG